MVGGIIISSDFFDENSTIEDFNFLKFIFASESRLKLLFSLYESNKTIKELESEFNRKSGNISRGLNDLKSCKLITRLPNKEYAITSVGFLYAKNLENLMLKFENIENHEKFLEDHSIKSIPNRFLKDISSFSGSLVKSNITEFAKPINVYLDNIEKSTTICMILPVFSKIFMDSIYEALINHDGYLDLLTTKTIYDLIVKSDSENYFKALVRDKKINYHILEDLSNVFFTVSDTFASIFLFYDDSVFDNSEMILIEGESGINDAHKFYNAYKNYVLK
ncbi:helix-turn-helix transcriptional regulator [Methanobrevibacter sp.]|uniref:helix-turn-helix transcriptional regulator n=1 Tax=Methanobrevibacter sp. TaxID=66852 RepID=UPI00388F2AA4